MKILVIEDDAKHVADAKQFFASQEGIEVVYVSTMHGAIEHLMPGMVDGVISDIYFPFAPYSKYQGDTYTTPEPIGVSVMMICWERGIPCTLNTAGYHHGPKYQWIHELSLALRWPGIIDASRDLFKDAPEKRWDLAFKLLKWLTEKGRCAEHQRYDICLTRSAKWWK